MIVIRGGFNECWYLINSSFGLALRFNVDSPRTSNEDEAVSK